MTAGNRIVMGASGGGGDGTLYNESAVRTAYRYPLNTQALADEVATTGRLTVTATNGERLTLLLTEFNNFAGNKTYIVWENGTSVEKPFPGRTFQGTLATDPDSIATLLIAPEGLYGSVQSRGKVWSFQPPRNQLPAADGTIIQEVSSYNVRAPRSATFTCLDVAKVAVSVGAQNGSLVQGEAVCPLALASCSSSTGTCAARSTLNATTGPGVCMGWVDDASSGNSTVSCQVGASHFATRDETDREELESSPDCSAFMDKWSTISGDASVTVLHIRQDAGINAQSYVWNVGGGCVSIQPRCVAQTRIVEGQARSGIFCEYGG